MKITLAFLLLGVCFVSTNANAIRRRKMLEHEAYSHGRMLSLVMKRWNDWQTCHKCNDVERYCLEKAVVEDLCFILRLLASDMGCKPRELLYSVKLQIHVTYLHNALEHGEFDSLTKMLRSTTGKLDHFVQAMCGTVNAPLKELNIDLGGILVLTNHATGGTFAAALHHVKEFVSGISNGLGGLTDGALNVVDGIAGGAITGAFGDLTGALGGVTGALGGATGALGSVTGAFGGATGALAGVTGALGGATKTVSNLAGSLTGSLGGILGGGGGKKGLLG